MTYIMLVQTLNPAQSILHQWIIFAKLLYLILVLFYYTERQANKWVVVFMFARWRLYMCVNVVIIGCFWI